MKKNDKKYEVLAVFTAVMVAFIYLGIKSFLGLFMSDNLSWVGLSLLLTYVVYDIIKRKLDSKE